MAKPGQVTIFFAIGIVLLIIVMLILYVSSAARETPELDNPYTSPTVKKYIDSCLDASFADSIALLSKQGGAFLDPALDGMAVTAYTVGDHGVALGIDSSTSIIVSPPYFVNLTGNFSYESKLFGTIVAPRLCSNVGPNARNQFNNQHCMVFAYPNPLIPAPVIQDSLRRVMERDMETCLADESVQESITFPIADLGDPEIEIILADRNVQVRLTFPNADVSGLRERPTFVKSYDIRLKILYEYMIDLLVKNTRDPRNKIEDTPLSPYFRQGFSVTYQQQSGSHLFQFIDGSPLYSFGGSPLALTVFVLDRQPFTDDLDPANPLVVDPDGHP